MNRARLLAFSAIALAGCRAVLGIESLTVDEDASVAPQDGAVSDVTNDLTVAPTNDATNDAGADTGTAPKDAAGDAFVNPCLDSSAMGGCQGCCRESYGIQVGRLEAYAREAGCICGPTTCLLADGCADSVCATPQSDPPPPSCGMCIDPLIGGCGSVQTACAGDPSCTPYQRCFQSCPHQ